MNNYKYEIYQPPGSSRYYIKKVSTKSGKRTSFSASYGTLREAENRIATELRNRSKFV